MTTTNQRTLRELAARDERVFPSYPQVARYFPSADMEDARKRLGRAIERGDGPGLVVGGPGVGKSLLLQVLAAQYHERLDVVLLACARLCTRRALLQAVLFELGLPYKLRDEGELRLGLLDHLLSEKECPAGLLLLVDEAHTLPMALLDELRVMTNLVRGGTPRVRLVVAGSAGLEEMVAHPELESFSQRLASRCYLAPLGREETAQYVRAQLAASQCAPDEVVAADAWDLVFEATDGVPRLVNQLCDRALAFAAAENRLQIDRQLLQRAWSDLQQLPMPWETPPETPANAAASQVVEFGGLSDEPSCAQTLAAEEEYEIEPTELDLDEAAAEAATAESDAAELAAEESVADPFAEEFEEEEVVLDAFVAWDEIFRREAPRVENGRDPGFAALVETVLETSPENGPASADAFSGGADYGLESQVALASEVVYGDETGETPQPDYAKDEDSTIEPDAAGNWPPIRLAVVSDPAPLQPIPLIPPAERVAPAGAADLAMVATRLELNRHPGKHSAAEAPVLIIEDDRSPGRGSSQVRRESYRNLFSRLRSG